MLREAVLAARTAAKPSAQLAVRPCSAHPAALQRATPCAQLAHCRALSSRGGCAAQPPRAALALTFHQHALLAAQWHSEGKPLAVRHPRGAEAQRTAHTRRHTCARAPTHSYSPVQLRVRARTQPRTHSPTHISARTHSPIHHATAHAHARAHAGRGTVVQDVPLALQQCRSRGNRTTRSANRAVQWLAVQRATYAL